MKREIPPAEVLEDQASAHPRPVDVGDAWRDAAADVEDAYRVWSVAPRPSRPDAYRAYVAAVDREAAAASYLELVWDRALVGTIPA